MFANSINTYRAIAILLIVATHCYSISGIQIDSTWEAVFINLTAGSTIHFVFISGFLFHHVFYQKGKTVSFFFTKAKRLLIPYTILSIPPIFFKIQSEPGFWNSYLPISSEGILNEYIIPSLAYYFTGAHLVAYWYIPFVICLFLMYPLHIKFIQLKRKNQIIIIVALYIIALLVHRPENKLDVLQSVVNLTPAYLLGILCSINKAFIYEKLKKKEYILLIIVMVLATFQALLGRYSNYEKLAFVYDGIDLMLLQKSIACILFMVFLHRFENTKTKFLTLLASTSFAIFFIHGYVLYGLTLLKSKLEITFDFAWPTYFLISATIATLSILLALLLKKTFPKHSKYLIGY